MAEPVSQDEIQRMLDDSPYIGFMNLEVVSTDPDESQVVIKMPMRPEFERRVGTGQYHGGAIAALIDIAGDYAVVLKVGGGVPTINFRVDYLRPATNTSLTATATTRRLGRSVAVVDIDVCDDNGKLCAVGRGTYSPNVG
ncbi:MAG: PaaI family thioesterase [Alphaproteobacteria bacterium]|nr:PaaI family thioesterase [Alphaproteobacteria bacterium]